VIRDNQKNIGNHDDFIIFVTTIVKCTTYTCGCKINLTLQLLFPVTCLTRCYVRRDSSHFSRALAAVPMPDLSQVKLTEEKVKAQVGKNRDNIMKRLLETKGQLQSETASGIQPQLRKCEKCYVRVAHHFVIPHQLVLSRLVIL
jgi:hypothetical protein